MQVYGFILYALIEKEWRHVLLWANKKMCYS